MKVLISTPLFPPEAHYPAKFSKSLAENISQYHEVSLLVFGDSPEQISSVNIVSISKKKNFLKKIFLFLQKSYKPISNSDIIILNQAGLFSFLTFILAKMKNKKIITKIKEDEVEERKKQFQMSSNNPKIKLINLVQKIVLKNSDTIIFDNENLKNNLSKKYFLPENKIYVLKHPKNKEVFPFENEEEEARKQKEEWLNYTQNFLNHLKKYE